MHSNKNKNMEQIRNLLNFSKSILTHDSNLSRGQNSKKGKKRLHEKEKPYQFYIATET
jgi:hypothetical protein